MLASFTFVDTAIVLVYILVSVAIGILASRSIHGMSGYLVAGRSLGTALSIATLTGSELGLITVMYTAEKGFVGGFAAMHIALIAGLVTLLVGLTGFIVVPLRRSRVMTIPEYYELRFGRRTRILGGVLLAVGGILNMGLFLRIGSQFVVGVTGLDPEGGALITIMVALLVLVLFYTVLGGMVSVVLTDYVQFVLLSMGLLLVVVMALGKHGFDVLFQVVQEHKGAAGFDPTLADGGFGPSYIAWQGVLGLVSCAIWPTAVTRALSARSEAVVRRQYCWVSIGFLIRFLIPCFLGICAFVFLVQSGAILHLDDQGMVDGFMLAEGGVKYANLDAFPLYLRELLPMGLLGLITAAMLAAFMSTHDSYLLCWASVITRDIVGPLRKKALSMSAQLLLTRVIVVLIGAYVLFWGLFYTPEQDLWEYLGITGAVYSSGAMALLIFGIYWRRASSTGAVLALLGGFTALAGLSDFSDGIERQLQQYFALQVDLQAWHVGLLTLGFTFALMIIGSLLFPDKNPNAPMEAAN